MLLLILLLLLLLPLMLLLLSRWWSCRYCRGSLLLRCGEFVRVQRL